MCCCDLNSKIEATIFWEVVQTAAAYTTMFKKSRFFRPKRNVSFKISVDRSNTSQGREKFFIQIVFQLCLYIIYSFRKYITICHFQDVVHTYIFRIISSKKLNMLNLLMHFKLNFSWVFSSLLCVTTYVLVSMTLCTYKRFMVDEMN